MRAWPTAAVVVALGIVAVVMLVLCELQIRHVL